MNVYSSDLQLRRRNHRRGELRLFEYERVYPNYINARAYSAGFPNHIKVYIFSRFPYYIKTFVCNRFPNYIKAYTYSADFLIILKHKHIQQFCYVFVSCCFVFVFCFLLFFVWLGFWGFLVLFCFCFCFVLFLGVFFGGLLH